MFTTSRYPNAPPYELYDDLKAKELLDSARKLIDFVEGALR